jgi:hypothetical protein
VTADPGTVVEVRIDAHVEAGTGRLAVDPEGVLAADRARADLVTAVGDARRLIDAVANGVPEWAGQAMTRAAVHTLMADLVQAADRALADAGQVGEELVRAAWAYAEVEQAATAPGGPGRR